MNYAASWKDTGIVIKVPKSCSLPDELIGWLWALRLTEIKFNSAVKYICCISLLSKVRAVILLTLLSGTAPFNSTLSAWKWSQSFTWSTHDKLQPSQRSMWFWIFSEIRRHQSEIYETMHWVFKYCYLNSTQKKGAIVQHCFIYRFTWDMVCENSQSGEERPWRSFPALYHGKTTLDLWEADCCKWSSSR